MRPFFSLRSRGASEAASNTRPRQRDGNLAADLDIRTTRDHGEASPAGVDLDDDLAIGMRMRRHPGGAPDVDVPPGIAGTVCVAIVRDRPRRGTYRLDGLRSNLGERGSAGGR
jgi:hypothetical protein